MKNKTTKIILYILVAVLVLDVVVAVAVDVNKLTPSTSTTTPNMVTLNDLYQKTLNIYYSTSSSPRYISTSTAPANSMYTLQEVWDSIGNFSLPDEGNVRAGTLYGRSDSPRTGAFSVNSCSDPATTPTIVLAIGNTNPVGGVTNVVVPEAGATDTTGAVTGWVTGTADRIKFTVTDGGSAVSTVTINGSPYTSGSDYTATSTDSLTIIVITTEAGKTTGTRTFTVTISAPVGFVCGDTLVDGAQNYQTVTVGSYCWTKQPMNAGTMINSSSGGTGGDGNMSGSSPIEKYCYDNNEDNCTASGGLYQWGEVMQASLTCNGTDSHPACDSPVQGICPSGWHIPSHYEVVSLERSLCSIPGDVCNSNFPYNTETTGWRGIDEGTSFKATVTAMPGYRVPDSTFTSTSSALGFWTSTEDTDLSKAFMRALSSSGDNATQILRIPFNKSNGLSVFCVKAI